MSDEGQTHFYGDDCSPPHVVTAQSEARQRLVNATEYMSVLRFLEAILNPDELLADVVAAVGRDRVLKEAGGTTNVMDLPHDGRHVRWLFPVSEGQ